MVVGACVVPAVVAARRPPRWPDAVRPATAVGDATCLSCHGDKASYETTAHRLTSRVPTRAAISGSFDSGANVLRTANPEVHYRMHADAAGFYQTAVVGRGANTTTRTERIAYVFGSGRKGQSYAYWAGDSLYQLPVSYWTTLRGWIISPGPGYGDGPPNFGRGIGPRCLECHATWMEGVPDLSVVNRHHPTGAILGITCERCHAGGQEHVARERSVLHAFRGPGIVNPARLSRARQIETCAQCHGGPGALLAPEFTYVPGQPLDAYLKLRQTAAEQRMAEYLAPGRPKDDDRVDVHGNQVALLARSRCFQASQMTCLTCHNVHRQQRDVVALSGQCVTCHQAQRCGLYPTRGRAIEGHCVDCHMPLQTSRVIVSTFGGRAEEVKVRTHWIRVYRDSAPTAPHPAPAHRDTIPAVRGASAATLGGVSRRIAPTSHPAARAPSPNSAHIVSTSAASTSG